MGKRVPGRRMAVAGSMALALGLAGITPAIASGRVDSGVERRGDCTKHSTWRLKVSPDDGRLRVEARVDTNVNGQTWSWRILHNGGVSARGKAKTSSGYFRIERLLVNAPGPDHIGLRASNAASGESCSGNVTY